MIDEPDRVESIEDGPETEWTVLGSRFLGQAFAVDDEEQTRARLHAIRKHYHDATHHCWAWSLGPREQARERWDDDGEPSGTAGVPIAGAIRHAQLTNLLVVVTRYFGGTKLGTGGLVRAYGEAARLALEQAPRRTLWKRCSVTVACSFDQLGIVEHVISGEGDAILQVRREYDPGPKFLLEMKASRISDLTKSLTELSAGRIQVHVG